MIGLDNLVGPELALDDVDLRRLLASLSAGTRPVDVARAFRISVRTVYRYRTVRLETIHVAGHAFTFVVFRDPKRRPVPVRNREEHRRAVRVKVGDDR